MKWYTGVPVSSSALPVVPCVTTFPLVAAASYVEYIVCDFINVSIFFSPTLYTVFKSTEQLTLTCIYFLTM